MNLFGLFDEQKQFIRKLEQSRPRLYRLAYSWCHNRALADDLTQEALSKAIAKAGQLRDADALESWLFGILANCLNDHYRRQRDTVDIDAVEEHYLVSEATGPEEEYLQSETVRRIRRAIAELPIGQRQVITLVDLEELSYAEVAGVLNIPVGTVMSRLCRARLALKELLREARPVKETANLVRVK